MRGTTHSFMRIILLTGLAACGTDWSKEHDELNLDQDGDGFTPAQGDCWDLPEFTLLEGTGITGAQIHPNAVDTPYNGVDEDCAGNDDYDLDGDQVVTDPSHVGQQTVNVIETFHHIGFGDCNDNNNAVFPGAVEVCNGIDDDCNGIEDDGEAEETKWYQDKDADGFGTEDQTLTGCDTYVGYVLEGGDCDDENALVYPGATEVCDSLDNDCDDLIDNDAADAVSWFRDQDEDGFGDRSSVQLACDPPEGYVGPDTDCDDSNAEINPDAQEVCDDLNIDEDCDGLSDDADGSTEESSKQTFHPDLDGDGYGSTDLTAAITQCDPISGYTENATDCDDGNANINPGEREICDEAGVDENCRPSDDADGSLWYADVDEDGYGDSDPSALIFHSCDDETLGCNDDDPSTDCAQLTNTDCDDTDAQEYPGADEYCDGDDDDCDGSIDESDAVDASIWYQDADADTYGDPSVSLSACTQPSSYVSDQTDCDDTDAAINSARRRSVTVSTTTATRRSMTMTVVSMSLRGPSTSRIWMAMATAIPPHLRGPVSFLRDRPRTTRTVMI